MSKYKISKYQTSKYKMDKYGHLAILEKTASVFI